MSAVKTYAWKIFFIILLGSTTPNLLADVFVAGLNAIDRSHYASAYRSFKPLADEGISEAQNNIFFVVLFAPLQLTTFFNTLCMLRIYCVGF